MQRLVDVLGRTEHRVIVSKGPLADQIRLHDNMTGESFLPQPAILPLVDLVITHGGNNTVVESFHNGKPMIVLPLFWDQVDNAQRVHETGFGRRLSTYGFADEELTGAIDALLADTALRERMAGIAARMQADRGTERAADLIERLATTHAPVLRAGLRVRRPVRRGTWMCQTPAKRAERRHLKPRSGAHPTLGEGRVGTCSCRMYQAPEHVPHQVPARWRRAPANLGCDHPEPTSGAEPPRSAERNRPMTSRERRTFFERLYAMREAYANLDAIDRSGITTITEAIAAAELELERISAEAANQAAADATAEAPTTPSDARRSPASLGLREFQPRRGRGRPRVRRSCCVPPPDDHECQRSGVPG